jgi:hypothetical protein|nr:MAG TPA: receptor binding protein [Caudoviricetes sp.]
MTDNKMERYEVKKAIKDLVKNINETTHIPIVTEDDIFELFQLDSIADLRKVSRNFLKLSKILDYFSTATEIATSEKEGIVKFGIENGNAVDVKDWIKGIGGVIGGYVSKVSNKEAGKWYLNDLTDGKIYKCIQNHTSTSFDTTKYLDISNYGLSDKLENLYKVQQAKLYVHAEAIGQGRTTCNIVEKVGSIVTIIFDSGNALRNINDNTVIFQIPDGFKPKTFLSVNASQYNTSNGTVYIEPSGIGKWKGATVNSASIIFSVSYIV